MGAVATALVTIIGVGWYLGRRGTLGAAALGVLARVCFPVATPCLLFVTVSHADLHLLLSRSALVTALSTSAVALIAIVMLATVWRRPTPDVVVGTLASSYVNAGNVGLPLAAHLLGDAVAVVPPPLFQLLVLAPTAFTILDAHLTAGRPGLGGIVARTFRNPIIVGSLPGLLLAAFPGTCPRWCSDGSGSSALPPPPTCCSRSGCRSPRPAPAAKPPANASWCSWRCFGPSSAQSSRCCWTRPRPGRPPAARRRRHGRAARPERARLRHAVRARPSPRARRRHAHHRLAAPALLVIAATLA